MASNDSPYYESDVDVNREGLADAQEAAEACPMCQGAGYLRGRVPCPRCGPGLGRGTR
jgi:uncharacterized paraquat-inducible protein A